MLYAVLATLGHKEMALEKALALQDEVFQSAGGSGHSLSNTLWYIASRPIPVVPYDLERPSSSIHSKSVPDAVKKTLVDCGCPDTCTENALRNDADGFTCKDRIQWLMTNRGKTELGACAQVADEYQSQCLGCNPGTCAVEPVIDQSNINETVPEETVPEVPEGCPPCSANICSSDLNRCQITTARYLCYEGPATGGCTPEPWATGSEANCFACCELFRGCEI